MSFISFDSEPKSTFIDFSTPEAPKPDQGDFGRGFKESFQQLPQLGYGLLAGAGAAAESAFGEGGIATGIKKAGIKGYQEKGEEIAKNSKTSDSWDYSYDQAKDGDFGALVDWVQHGIGYVGGQGIQTLITGGIGAVGGKFVASTAAKQIAEGMVAKEVATIGASEAAKKLTAIEIGELATANVASKFANIGQSVALGANAFGMEGGEIFGDLASSNKDRVLTGSELGKAFAATLAAGGLEFIGDKVGLDIMLGKSKLLKPAESMTGYGGRASRGIIAGAAAAPIEGGTEYLQTGFEEFGKGKEASLNPLSWSEETKKNAFDAAALGALGGTVMGGVGGAIRGPKPLDVKPDNITPKADPIAAITAPEVDSVDKAVQVFQESVPSISLADRRASAMESVGQARSNWEAIKTANDEQDLSGLVESERRNLQVMQARIAEERQKQAEMDRIPGISQEQNVVNEAVGRASALETPTAMSAAFGKLFDKTIAPEPEAPIQQAAIAASNRASSTDTGETGNAQSEEGLTSYTPEDVKAEEARLEQITKDKAKADKDAEAKDKADRIAKEIESRQLASSDNFQLGQSAEEGLSGRGSIFDAPVADQATAKSAPKPITELTFDQWARQEYDISDYKDTYLEAFEGNENRATLGSITGTDDNGLSTNELLKRAKQDYIDKLLNQPREAVLSLEVWDSLTPAQRTEAQRNFYDLDGRITKRLQDQGSASAAEQKAAKQPYQDALDKVDSEIKRLDAISGPDTEKVKDLRARRENLKEALFAIGQGNAPDGRLLRAKSEAEPADQATAILDAANVTGKERIDVLKDVKQGAITPDELKAAYPAKEDGSDSSSSTNASNGHSVYFQEALDAGSRGTNELRDFVEAPSFFGKIDKLLQIPIKSGESGKPTKSIDGLTTSGKSSLNDVRVHVEAIRNLLQGIAAAKQNLSMADVETQRLVLFHVLALSKNSQVLQAVVQLVPVDVVNDLSSRQLSPDSLFNDSSVVSSSIAGDLSRYVPALSKAPETFVRAIALAGAEVSSRSVGTNLEGPTKDGVTTSSANNSDLRHGANYTRNDGNNLQYTPASKIDTPAQGVLANAKEQKANAFTRLKKLRQQVADGRSELRLELIKAESAHKDALRYVSESQAQIERDANKQGLTTIKPVQETDAGVAMFSRSTIPDVSDERTGVSTALLYLGQNEDLYQYPRSDSLELQDIADDKATPDKAAIKVGDVDKASDDNKVWLLSNTTPDDNQAQGVKSWILTLPTGKFATLTKKGNEVYINVSGVGEGMGGSSVYDLAANFALNNGLVFIGDPLGVSKAAMRRRLENMLSSAIKYGTTDHLEPHPDQYIGNEEIGVPALDWTKGDTLSNIRSMVDVSIASTERSNPLGAELVYDNVSDSFKAGSTGATVGIDAISRMAAGDRRTSGAGQAGYTTLQRSALFKSLVQSAGARREFLVQLHRKQNSGSKNPSGSLKDSFYSRGQSSATGITADQFTTELTKAFGAKVADNLQSKGVVVALEDQSQLPSHVVPFLRDGDIVYGFYDPKTNKTYAVLENLTPDMVKGLVLHEVGVHYGFKSMLGDAKYANVMQRLDVMRKAGSKSVKEAYAEAKKNSVRDSQVPEETLAYLIQNHPEMSLVKEIIAKIKAFLYTEFGIGGKYLKEDDLIMLAKAAVDHSSRMTDGGSIPAFMRKAEERADLFPEEFATKRTIGDSGVNISSKGETRKGANVNNDGEKITATKQGVDNFWKWFGDSAAADEKGRPLVLYHSTNSDFDTFEPGRETINSTTFGDVETQRHGIFTSPDKKFSQEYLRKGEGQNVMQVYAAIQNPIDLREGINGDDLNAIIAAHGDDGRLTHRDFNYVDPYETWTFFDGGFGARFVAAAKAAGFDGAIMLEAGPDGNKPATTYVAFDANQVKSATGNRGTFSANSGDIRFSRSIADTLQDGTNNPRSIVNATVQHLNDRFTAPGTMNWWHKSVGTQYNLAQRSPAFKRVFDSVQNFINDTSFYATEAASLAPNLIPKLESWKDIFRKAISTTDSKAIAAPVFEGTLTWARDESGALVKMEALEAAAAKLTVDQKSQRLLRNDLVTEQALRMWRGLEVDQYESIINNKYEQEMLKAGVVFTDSELKQNFNLTPEQISLYKEFRVTTDKSLNDLTISHMLKLGGKDTKPIAEMALAAKDAHEASQMLADYLHSLALEDDKRSAVLMDAADRIVVMSDKAKDLIDRGYAPLSRFGQYTVDVISNGERVYFGMFESKLEANKMADKMKANYPDSSIQQGTVSQEEYKLFAGVTPETLELFGDMLGLDTQGSDAKNIAFQEYLKAAKSNRSAMKRLIQRKGITGFSEDAARVLAGFVYSNARQTSSNLHAGEIANATADIPKGEGEVKDAAIKLATYVQNPQDEAQAIRGLMFAQFIGGSVASAMVNLTQPFTMTLPWLSQYGGIQSASKQMIAATRDAIKAKTGDAKLDAALRHAEEEGIVSPQEVHQLQGQASGRGSLQTGDGTKMGDAMATANNNLSRVQLAWGKLFGLAEQFNRRSTFIAAYRTAVEQKIADPAGFAAKAIAETQGVYNKGNKPAWARGAVGSTLFTFKQFSISYVEMIHRMALGPNATHESRMAALYAMGVMVLVAGVGGLPGADDLDDVISGLLQSMGYNFDSKAKRRAFLTELLGTGGQRFVEHGLSGLPGVPIDVSGRLGLGNLIPGTGLLTKKTDHTSDVAELAGPVADLAKRTFSAGGKLVKGDIGGAAVDLLPLAGRNIVKAADMYNMGMYRDQSVNHLLA